MPHITLLAVFCCLFAVQVPAEVINDLWDRGEVMRAPTVVWGATTDKPSCIVKSLTFTGLGHTYAAYVAVPKKLSGKAPGVVLVHGGAGGAFSQWAEQWANKGYVAIAPDFNFKMSTDSMFMKRNSGTLKDMWTYHSVAAVMRAVSVVSSQPETDPDKIAMMGISWGGYLTCIVSSIDPRVKVAIPVYGCGFYDEAEAGSGWHGPLTSVDLATLTSTSEQQEWLQAFDCKTYLPKMNRPIFFMTGTGDGFYPLNTHYKSIQLPTGDTYFRVLVNWSHGYNPAWDTPEPIAFADQYLQGATPLVRFTGQGKEGDAVWITYTSEVDISSADLISTSNTSSVWVSRPWTTSRATVAAKDTKVSAPLPAGTAAYFFKVTDSRGYITTSAMQVPNYTVLPSPPHLERSKKLSTTGWLATASANMSPERGLDGRLDSRATKGSQQVGDWYTVDMKSLQEITAVVLHCSAGDFPRGYAVYVSKDGTNWGTPIATGSGTESRVAIPIPTQATRFIKVALTADAKNWWSIVEFEVFQ